MLEKINVSKIFKDHWGTLKNYDKKNVSITDIFLFYILPLIFSIIISFYVKLSFIVSISSELITFYSVLGGFMLNLLALIYGFDITKFKTPELAKRVLKELSSNISYLIALASILVVLLFVTKSILGISLIQGINYFKTVLVTKKIMVAFFIFTFTNFSLTILMILKRFYSLNSNRG